MSDLERLIETLGICSQEKLEELPSLSSEKLWHVVVAWRTPFDKKPDGLSSLAKVVFSSQGLQAPDPNILQTLEQLVASDGYPKSMYFRKDNMVVWSHADTYCALYVEEAGDPDLIHVIRWIEHQVNEAAHLAFYRLTGMVVTSVTVKEVNPETGRIVFQPLS